MSRKFQNRHGGGASDVGGAQLPLQLDNCCGSDQRGPVSEGYVRSECLNLFLTERCGPGILVPGRPTRLRFRKRFCNPRLFDMKANLAEGLDWRSVEK